MNWDNIRIFLALARAGSVRGASKTLNINHSTVSRRISAFEGELGVRLFDRLASGYVLTATGQELLPYAEKIEAQCHNIELKIMGQDYQLRGPIRVTLPDLIGTHLLAADLVEFTNLYPDIELVLLTSYETFNLNRREADVAIRVMFGQPDGYLVKKKIVTYNLGIYASRDYLKQHPEQSQQHWIGWTEEEKYPEWVKKSDFPLIPTHHNIGHPYLQFELAKKGLGLTMIACFLADNCDELVRLSPNPIPDRSIWLLTHEDLYKTERIRVFMDFIETALLKHRDMLEGNLK